MIQNKQRIVIFNRFIDFKDTEYDEEVRQHKVKEARLRLGRWQTVHKEWRSWFRSYNLKTQLLQTTNEKGKEKIVTQATIKKRNKAVRTLICKEKENQHQNRWWSRLMIYKQFDWDNEPESGSYTQGESVTEKEEYKIQ